MALSLGAAAVLLAVAFTMVHVGTTPRRALWERAAHFDFAGPFFSPPTGGAPLALCAWHGLCNVQARSERAETGLIGRSPTTPVGTFGIYTHSRGRGGSMSLGMVVAWGVWGGEILGLCRCRERTVRKQNITT